MVYTFNMSPKHFSKTYMSPYFSSNHYKETQEYKNEQKVELFIIKVIDKLLFIPRLFKKKKITNDKE